ncbi:MAG: Hemagglutinin-related protein [Parcubacteria group bacterium GW2011_GWA1_48_11b]|nr:MAG: Hemagglutinin-related protein [Parcubacteria group bacterium GW2011_GWA1_48_11b]
MGNPKETAMPQPPSTKNPIPRLIPLLIVMGALAVAASSQMGYITLPHIDLPFGQSGVNKISPDATVGAPSSYEFSELISFLPAESHENPAIYTFYLGSGVGFPPMGLILGIDGVLRGTPTVKGTSKFQVCVKDVGGRSVCETYSLTVNPASGVKNTTSNSNNSKNTTCPTRSNPPCRSVQNGVGVTGVVVPASCDCPSDTNFAQMDNITAGGPYKICTCK